MREKENERKKNLITTYTKGMEHIKMSIGIISNDKIGKYFFDGKAYTSDVPNYIYEVGSITKTLTISFLCKLMSQGKIKLDDRVSDFIQGLPNEYYYPTIRQLATHMAGYGREMNYPDKMTEKEQEKRITSQWSGDYIKDNLGQHLTEEDMILFVKGAKLTKKIFPWEYSNLGISLLGYILGKIAGRGYHIEMKQYIEDELMLKHTYLDRPQVGSITGFDENNNDCGNWIWKQSPFAPAGSIYSTLDDMLKYEEIHMNEKFSYLEESHKCIEKEIGKPKTEMGLGWVRFPEDGIVWHNGGTGCFRSFLGFNKYKKVGSVVLSNYTDMNGVTTDDIGLEIIRNA